VKRASSAEPISSPFGRGATRGKRSGDDPRSAQAPILQKTGGSAWSLWLWVGAGFLFLGLLWTGMVIATRRADTRTVPLATQEAGP
jgi:hypothetical protein